MNSIYNALYKNAKNPYISAIICKNIVLQGEALRLEDISNRLEYVFGQDILHALLNAKNDNKALLYLPYTYQTLYTKQRGGGGQYVIKNDTKHHRIEIQQIKDFLQHYNTQDIKLNIYEKKLLSLKLRLTKIKLRIRDNIKLRITRTYKELHKHPSRVTNINDIAKIYGIKNALIYSIGDIVRSKKKLNDGIDIALQEIKRLIKARILQSMLNNIAYGYIDNIHMLGNIDLLHLSYNRIDTEEAKSCHKINILCAKDTSLNFIEHNLDSIIEWLSSQACKERYIQTNHPYIPLLDPNNFDYKLIESSIAWDLNIPLQDNYEFVAITRGLQGHSAFSLFLSTLFSTKLSLAGRYYGDIDTAHPYRVWYEALNNTTNEGHKKNILFLVNATEEGGSNKEKLAYLSWGNKEILCLVRDPISRLKSGVNHVHESEQGKDHFSMQDDCHEIVKYWIAYGNGLHDANEDKPDLSTALTYNSMLQPRWLYIDSYFYKPHDNITYIDMSEIQGQATIKTMQYIANKFQATMPDNHDVYLSQSGGILGYMLMGHDQKLAYR